MALISWDNALCCGVQSIDDQHRKLVEMVNELHDGMKNGKGNAMLGDILQKLATYTVEHFRHEEQLMAMVSGGIVAQHKQEHAKLLATVSDFVGTFKAGKTPLTMEVLGFLKKWLVDHIQGMDIKTFRTQAKAA